MTPSTPSHKHARGTWIRWVILPLLLGAATVVLISKTTHQEMEVTISVTVNNLADDLLLTDTPRPTVKVLVSGSPSILKTIDSRKTACRLNLAGLSEGTHHVPVRPTDIGLPEGVSLAALLTPSLNIHLETVSRKTAGLVAELKGNPAPGFTVTAVTLKPDHIVIEGTATLLADIDTIKTGPINIEAASESFKKEVPLNLPESIAVDAPLRIVVAQVEIKERIINRVLANIPVSGKGTAADHQIHPDTISLTVSGPEVIVNTIETNPAFAVTIDLEGLAPGTHGLKATIGLPVRTTLVSVSPKRFSVTISQ